MSCFITVCLTPQCWGPTAFLSTPFALAKGGIFAEDNMVALSVIAMVLGEEWEVSLEVPGSKCDIRFGLSDFFPVRVLSMAFLVTPLDLMPEGLRR